MTISILSVVLLVLSSASGHCLPRGPNAAVSDASPGADRFEIREHPLDVKGSAKGRGARENAIIGEKVKPGYTPSGKYGDEDGDDVPDRAFVVVVKPAQEEVVVSNLIPDEMLYNSQLQSRTKNASEVVPLHVTDAAKKCLDGFKADENGMCQKALTPKGEKRMSRRKRAEHAGQKPSYADIVKYGRNQPKNVETTTEAAEILTPKQRATTEAATPAPVAKAHKTKPPPKKEQPASTAPPPPAATAASTTEKHSAGTKSSAAPAAASSKQGAKPTQAPATSPTVKVAAAPPATTKKPHYRVSSAVANANEDFLSGEKASAIAQSQDGRLWSSTSTAGKKSAVDLTRLRRSVRFF